MIFGHALFSGSALMGAEFAIGFSLGTLPLLWLAQSQFMRGGGIYLANRVGSAKPNFARILPAIRFLHSPYVA